MTTTVPEPLKTLGADPTVDRAAANESLKLSAQDAQRLVGWAKDEYGKCKSARNSTQIQWYVNMSFYYGKQWVEYLKTVQKLTTPPAPPYRVRHTANRIRPLIRTELARITSNKPNASVVPASSEDEDMYAAMAGEQVWESLYSRKNIHTIFSRAAFWQAMTGVGFMKTYWDNSAYDRDSGQRGDICYGSVTPFHLFVPDLREEEIEGQPYVINVYTRPVEWVRRFWGERLDGTKIEPSVVSANEILDDVYLNIGGGASTTAQPDSCLIVEAWVKPGGHPLLPNGGLITIVDNQIVQFSDDGLPYKHGEFPFTKFEHVPSGKFYSDSTLVDVIPLQREYNRTRSQIIEAKNRMAKPQLLYPIGSIDPAKITTEPGQAIGYRPGLGKPEPLPLQPLPAYVLQDLQQVLMDIEDISGQHQVSKGNTPPGVTAATAISYLQEKDDSYLSHAYNSIEKGWEKIARQSLQLAVQYWDTQRVIRTVGTDGAFDTLLLSSSDIKNGTDIRVEGGSALPVSKAARQAFIMDMMKMGFIDPQEGLKMMEIGGMTKLTDQMRVDEKQAQRENIRFKRLTDEDVQIHAQEFALAQEQGAPETQDGETQLPLDPPPVISVNSWDNHAVHIKVHNDFRKSQAFELLPDSVKAEIEKHVTTHIMAAGAAMGMDPSMMGDPAMEDPNAAPEEPGAGNQFSGMEGMGAPNGAV